jgi:hypothetical protein
MLPAEPNVIQAAVEGLCTRRQCGLPACCNHSNNEAVNGKEAYAYVIIIHNLGSNADCI